MSFKKEKPNARFGVIENIENIWDNIVNERAEKAEKAREEASSSKGIEEGSLVWYQGKKWEVHHFTVDERLDLITPGKPKGPKRYNVDPRSNVRVIKES
jgi:hypothetical protein